MKPNLKFKVKHTFTLLLALACLINSGVGTVYSALNADDVNGRYMLLFKDKINESLIKNENLNIIHRSESIPLVTVSAPWSEIERLRDHPDIVQVTKDEKLDIKEDWGVESTVTPVTLDEQAGQAVDWGIDRLHVKDAWKSGYTGQGVKIAVIDTGIEPTHEDLAVAGGASFVSYTKSYRDDNGHGTHIAGIIGAKDNNVGVVGVAPKSSLYAVKALDQDGGGNISDIVAGIDWAISNHMDIINLSLGTTEDSPALKAVIDKAAQQGIVVVAAAGNDGQVNSTDTVEYPAKYGSVIAVAATEITDVHASFSSFGPEIRLAAPGDRILSTYLGNSYARIDGTSMAAPYVSGTMALWKQAYPNSNAYQLRTLATQNALPLGKPGQDPYYGFGLVQAPYAGGNLEHTAEPAAQPGPGVDVVKPLYLPDRIGSLTIDETEKSIYSMTQNSLLLLDKDTLKIKKEAALPVSDPNAPDFMLNYKIEGNTIYVMTRNQLYMFEKGTLHQIGRVQLPDYNTGVGSFEIDNGKAFVSLPGQGLFYVIDLNSNHVDQSFRLNGCSSFAEYRNRIYYASYGDVIEYDISTGLSKHIGKSKSWAVTLDREHGRLYSSSDTSLQEIDLTYDHVITQSQDDRTLYPEKFFQDGDQIFYGGNMYQSDNLASPVANYGERWEYVTSANQNYLLVSGPSNLYLFDRNKLKLIRTLPHADGAWVDLDGNVYSLDSANNVLSRTSLNPTGQSEQKPAETDIQAISPKAYRAADIQGHWAYEILSDFIDADIVRGSASANGGVLILPNDAITRAEFTALLVRALNLQADGGGRSFRDVKPTDWFYEPVRIASQTGIINGVSEDEFQPGRPITRAEIASILARAFASSVSFAGQEKKFNDIQGHWAYDNIVKVSKAGIIDGYSDGSFGPGKNATRAEAVVMLSRSVNKEQAHPALDSELISVVSNYENERLKSIHAGQYDGLAALNHTFATGYMESYRQDYDALLRDWVKEGYQFDTYTNTTLSAKVIQKSDRFAQIELSGLRHSFNTNYYGTLINGEDLKGIYYLKKNASGDWVIYNFNLY